MTLCPHHRATIASARDAISGHRRRKIADAIARSIAKSCPQCIALNEESK